jgi:hypothetical protein
LSDSLDLGARWGTSVAGIVSIDIGIDRNHRQVLTCGCSLLQHGAGSGG